VVLNLLCLTKKITFSLLRGIDPFIGKTGDADSVFVKHLDIISAGNVEVKQFLYAIIRHAIIADGDIDKIFKWSSLLPGKIQLDSKCYKQKVKTRQLYVAKLGRKLNVQ
jgi:hypothetical protein